MKENIDNAVRNGFVVFYGGDEGSFASRAAKLFADIDAEAERRAAAGETAVWMRLFFSDMINQWPVVSDELERRGGTCVVSVVEQAPLRGCKIAAMVFFARHAEVSRVASDAWSIRIDGRSYVYQAVRPDTEASPAASPHDQTVECFERHKRLLAGCGMNVRDNTLRTWLFCRDIDLEYASIVKGRNDFFAANGLNRNTHFIASTGIGGGSQSPRAALTMELLSREGERDDVKYLHAADHINSTIEYGVAFERAVAFNASSRRVTFVSGTASIDKHGKCINVGNPAAQASRLLDNISALLASDGSTLNDVKMMIVYMRDFADFREIEPVVRSRVNCSAIILVHAKVCRPAWLVEAECIASREL